MKFECFLDVMEQKEYIEVQKEDNYHNGEIYFQRGNEKSYDLVSMIIYSWWCDEAIDLELNNSIESTFKLLEKHTTILQDDIDDLLFVSPYWYHNGKVK